MLAISAWIFLVILTLIWIYSLSHSATGRSIPIPMLGDITIPVIIAFVIYAIGIVHTEVKERIA